MDKIDQKILSELSKDSSISIPKLAEKINVNSSVVYSRIKRLVKKKFIERFTIEVNNKEISVAGLPSAPEDYYAFHEDPTRPQPRMEREVGDGMTTTIGRVEKEELFDNGIKYMLFSHNKKMGSAKGAVLLAEMLYKKDKI